MSRCCKVEDKLKSSIHWTLREVVWFNQSRAREMRMAGAGKSRRNRVHESTARWRTQYFWAGSYILSLTVTSFGVRCLMGNGLCWCWLAICLLISLAASPFGWCWPLLPVSERSFNFWSTAEFCSSSSWTRRDRLADMTGLPVDDPFELGAGCWWLPGLLSAPLFLLLASGWLMRGPSFCCCWCWTNNGGASLSLPEGVVGAEK